MSLCVENNNYIVRVDSSISVTSIRALTAKVINQTIHIMSKDGDQIEELEALMAIFPNELTVLNNEYGHRCLELVLQPEEDASKCYVLAALTVKYPLDYPDVEPQVQVQARKGLSENQVEELQSTAQRYLDKRDLVGSLLPC